MSYDPNEPTLGPQDPLRPGQPPYGQPPYGQYRQPAYGQPQQPPTGNVPPPYGPEYSPPPYGQPQYGVPNYTQPPQQQPKKSLRWLWITLAIIGGIIVLACAGCGIFAYMAGRTVVNVAGPTLIAEEYYQYVKQRNYAQAYTLLDKNATITIAGKSVPAPAQQPFVTAAQAVDASIGPVSNFSIRPNSSDTSHLTVTVTRGSQTYDVHLILAQLGGNWKITSMDGI